MSPTIARSAGEDTPVRRLANHTLATVPPDATLQQVAEELALDEIGLVVVVAQGRETLGVVSERDLVAVIAAGGRLDGQATDLMTVDLVSAPEDTTVLDVARLMVDAGVRHVLATAAVPEDDRDAPVVGTVSMRDVVGFLLDDAV
jgi:signal-transduction protein with cAMP-binding, CBS, and nucleotidyltransferase domain